MTGTPRHSSATALAERAERPAAGTPGMAVAASNGSSNASVDLGVVARSWWALAGVVLLLWAFLLLGSVTEYPYVTVAVVAAGAWGLLVVEWSWAPVRRARARRRARAAPAPAMGRVVAWTTVGVVLAMLVIWAVLQIAGSPGYGTDEIAFDQYAAQLLVHGLDPYRHSMAPAFALFHVQPDGYTFRLDGAPVTQLSYPALSFLVYAPLLLAGVATQAAVALNVVAWAATIVVVFALLPHPLRPMALVLGSLSMYIGYAVGGVTVPLYLPMLAGAALAWPRFGRTQGWRAWRGPVLLGLAMAVNQAPWFVLPFVVVGIGLEAGHAEGWRLGVRTSARYSAWALGAALVPNLPFIMAGGHAWLTGVLTPLQAPTVPAGQGLVALSLYLDMGGGSLISFSALAVVVLVGLLVVYAATYPTLRAGAFLLPAVVLFFATRSYGNYLVGLIPAALVAAATAGVPPLMAAWRHWRGLTVGVLAVALAGSAWALADPSPLTLAITSVQTTGQLATVDQVQVRVTNRSGHRATPRFTLSSGDAVTAFWVAEGPRTLRPDQRATYTLLSPNFYAQPPITSGFQVVAFTEGPASVSHSSPYLPTADHVDLVPDAVSRVVPIGQTVTVRAEILDRLDRPVREAGVPVYLGQVIYAQQGLEYGEAVINSGQIGQTPVAAYTDDAGVATFTIRGTRAGALPVYFEANLVNDVHYYPYGYSQILPIRFGTGKGGPGDG